MAIGDIKNRSMLQNTKTDATDDEVERSASAGRASSQDVDDMLSSIGTRGLDVVEGDSHSPYSALEHTLAQETEEVELDLTPSAADSTSDPVRVYLREMGASPLLTREEEVEIAKRIERGQVTSLKALSRSPIVIQQVLAIGEDLKRGLRSIKDTVVFDEEEITDEILQKRVEDVTGRIDELNKHYKSASRLAERLATLVGEKEASRISPLPRTTWPRDGPYFAHHSESGVEPRRAQASDRTREQDHRAHARRWNGKSSAWKRRLRRRAATNSRKPTTPRSASIAWK